MLGDDMYRLLNAAAGAARRAGDDAAARDLAAAATTVYRFAGVFARHPPADEARALLAAARELAGDDPAAQAAVALADCGVLADAFIAQLTEPETTVAETAVLAEQAVELARRTGDRLAESAALDALTGAHCWAGAAFDAAGCRYQWARTLSLAGGEEATTGAAALAALGLAPMGAGIGG
jgi:hypothetical protein